MSSPAAVNVRSLEVTPKIPLINTSHKYKNPFKLVGYNIAAVYYLSCTSSKILKTKLFLILDIHLHNI